MAIRDARGGMLARCMVAVVTLSSAALASRAGADGPEPPAVLGDKTGLPSGCESIEHCGPYSYCYTGVAYRCPKPGATPAAQ